MASRLISALSPRMQAKAGQVEVACAQKGVELLIYCTHRDVFEQARHYRTSRTLSQITQKVNQLIDRGYPELAAILVNVGPQRGTLGKHITWAGPGESWHQYTEAFDAVPLVGGKCLWSYKKYPEQWNIYGDAVEALGLSWGGRFRDFPHCCGHAKTNPLDVLTPDEVRKHLNLG